MFTFILCKFFIIRCVYCMYRTLQYFVTYFSLSKCCKKSETSQCPSTVPYPLNVSTSFYVSFSFYVFLSLYLSPSLSRYLLLYISVLLYLFPSMSPCHSIFPPSMPPFPSSFSLSFSACALSRRETSKERTEWFFDNS